MKQAQQKKIYIYKKPASESLQVNFSSRLTRIPNPEMLRIRAKKLGTMYCQLRSLAVRPRPSQPRPDQASRYQASPAHTTPAQAKASHTTALPRTSVTRSIQDRCCSGVVYHFQGDSKRVKIVDVLKNHQFFLFKLICYMIYRFYTIKSNTNMPCYFFLGKTLFVCQDRNLKFCVD